MSAMTTKVSTVKSEEEDHKSESIFDKIKKAWKKIEKGLIIIGLICASLELVVEIFIYWTFASYKAQTLCCGLIANDVDDENIHGVSIPCDMYSVSEYGISVNPNNICVVNGVLCDSYNWGAKTLSDCLDLAPKQYNWNIDVLCDSDTMNDAVSEFKQLLTIYILIVILGLIVNSVMDLFQLICPNKENKAKRLCEECSYNSCLCFCGPCKNSGYSQKTRKIIAFWLVQALIWIFAFTNNTLTQSGTETGYQQIGGNGDVAEDNTQYITNTTSSASAPDVIYEFTSEYCNNGDGPIIADVNDLLPKLKEWLVLGSILSWIGIMLSIIGVLTAIYGRGKETTDNEMEMQQQIQMQQTVQQPIQTRAVSIPQQQVVYSQPQPQQVVYTQPQPQQVVYAQPQPQIVYTQPQQVVYVQPQHVQPNVVYVQQPPHVQSAQPYIVQQR